MAREGNQGEFHAVVIIAITLCSSVAALGQNNDTWDGGGGDDNWGSGNNWADNSAPSLNSQVNFAGSTRTTPFYNYGSFDAMYRIFFNSGASSFTLNGNAIKLADFGGNVPKVENSSTNKQTLQFANFAWNSTGEINPVNGDIDVNLGGGTGSMFLDNSTELRVFGNNGKKLTFFSPIKNGNATGSFNLKQASEVIFAAANTYNGDTLIEAGTISYAAGGSTASPFHRIGATGSSTDATLRITDADGGTTVANGVVIRSGTGARRIQATNTSGTNTFGGNFFLDGNAETSIANGGTIALTGVSIDLKNQTLSISGDGNTFVANGLKNPGAGETGSLIKTGAGRAYIAGSSTYRGTTTITNGQLIVTGTHTGAGSYAINSNGTLGGGGEITLDAGRDVTIAGAISPGEGAGELTLNNTGGGVTNFAHGGKYSWEINSQTGAAGVAWDLLDLDAVSVTADTNGFTIKIISLNGSNAPGPTPGWVAASPTQPKTFTIATSSSNSFTTAMLEKFTIDTSQYQDAYPNGWSLSVGDGGGSLRLVYVPEPSTLAAVMVGTAALLGRRRRSARHTRIAR